jgi:hypothetical protein
MTIPQSSLAFYTSKFVNGVRGYLFWRSSYLQDTLVSPSKHIKESNLTEPLQDKSNDVVLQSAHYIAIGEHADLWEGRMYNRKVTMALACYEDVPSLA